MSLRTLKDLDLQGKKVLLRSEFNVPMKNGKITDDTRIKKALPTIEYLLNTGAALIICAHLGRPKGEVKEEFSLAPIAKRLERLLGRSIKKMDTVIGEDVQNAAKNLQSGEVMLLENIRFEPGEEKNDPAFAKQLASLADIYVSDAFGAVHRAHASTYGVADYLPAYAGQLVAKEIMSLGAVFQMPKKPVLMIVAGSKMETKVEIIDKFLEVGDKIVIGGGIANTFLAAQGYNIGASLYEESEIATAKNILEKDVDRKIYIPQDYIVSTELSDTAKTRNVTAEDIAPDEKILDIGEVSAGHIAMEILKAGTVIWNGPVGVYEFKPFSYGTRVIASVMAGAEGDTILGGGNTVEAVLEFGHHETEFTHVSTGGGASLEFLEGKELPGVKILKNKK